MAEPYLTATQAAARLTAYGVETTVYEGDLLIASDTLDALSPFIGERYDRDQERAFPRSETLPGDVEGETPGRVLDAVSLLAATEAEGGPEAPIKSEVVLSSEVTYATARTSPELRRVRALVRSYQRRTGRM